MISSVGIILPNMWKVIKFMFQTTNQYHKGGLHLVKTSPIPRAEIIEMGTRLRNTCAPCTSWIIEWSQLKLAGFWFSHTGLFSLIDFMMVYGVLIKHDFKKKNRVKHNKIKKMIFNSRSNQSIIIIKPYPKKFWFIPFTSAAFAEQPPNHPSRKTHTPQRPYNATLQKDHSKIMDGLGGALDKVR